MASDVSSQSSYSTGADSSVASSSDARALNELSRTEDGIADDLTEQNRTLEDAVFASLYTLSKNRKTTDWRWTTARIVLEFLQMFRVVFNTVFIWKIDTDLWIWKAFYWVLFRLVVLPEGYSAYVTVFYVISAIVLVQLGLTAWIAVVLKKDENAGPWIRRLIWVLQLVGLILFSVFWVAILDYFAFMFDCEWVSFNSPRGAYHIYFPEKNCLAMPHLVHMVCAIIMVLVFGFSTLCMSISDCSLNPLTRDHLASPVAVTNLKTMGLKMVMVIVSTSLVVLGRAQPVIMLICAAIITYFLLRTLPFFMTLINCTWVGLWTGITFTTVILVVLEYSMDAFSGTISADALEHRRNMTMAVLYGIFPAVLLGAAITYGLTRWQKKPLAKLAAAQATADISTNLRDVYRFTQPTQAEFLLRAVRKWDEDGVPDPQASAFGDFVLKVAMARLPNNPYMLTLFANFIIETRKDGQAARTQLQLAVKANPTLLDRYFIYVAQETAKKLKSEGDGLDLMGYVEFQRSYRACVRAHKLALQAQRQFWHLLLRDNVVFRDLQLCFDNMDKSEKQATAVYRRVMDRFPANGKLLKIYGRFLEFVRNDPWNASRFYAEAMKQGTSESLLSLAGSSTEADSTSRLTQLMGNVDEKFDGIIIINAAGIIMMINGAGYRMLGYEKGELEGKNVSTLMPQPFSSRHNGFLQRYVATGESRIMGNLRQVVALHKDRNVFPLSMVVQRLCGVGSDAIFMSVMRPAVVSDPSVVKVWATTAGVVLCADERFKDWFGHNGTELVGRQISSLSTDIEGFDKFVAQVAATPPDQVVNGGMKMRTRMLHKYLNPIDTEVTIEYGGSDDHVILIIVLRCLADSLSLMVTDAKGRIAFANSQLAQLLGYNARTLTDGMNMSALLPPPYAQIHAGYMKDLSAKPPPGSCRAGAVVHLMHANNSRVPVTLQLSQHDDGDHLQHVVKVFPATELVHLNQQRLELSLNHRGRVLAVNEGASKAVFGFEPSQLVGKPLSSFINLFGQWKAKHGSEESLLTMLALRVEQNHDVILRCGLHNPFTEAEIQQRYGSGAGGGVVVGPDAEAAAAAAAAGLAATGSTTTLLTALKSRTKERPAIMTLAMVHNAEDDTAGGVGPAAAGAAEVDLLSGSVTGGGSAAAAAAVNAADLTPLLKLSLWRSEGLTSQLELDGKLGLTRSDPAAGLIFGANTAALLHKSYKKIVGLPACTTAADLVSGSGKKSMLKQGAAWKMGQRRDLETTHLDGGPIKLQMQAMSKDGKSTSRLLVLLRVVESSCGSLQPLLALKADALGAGANTNKLLGARAESESESEEGGGGGGSGDEGAVSRRRGDSPDLHDRLDSRLRTEEWLSSSFRRGQGDEGKDPDSTAGPAAAKGAASGCHGPLSPRGKGPAGRPAAGSMRGPGGGGKGHFAVEEEEDEQEEGYGRGRGPAGHGHGGGHGYVEVRIPPRAGAGPLKGGKPPLDGYSDASGGSKGVGEDGAASINGGGSVASSSNASGSEAMDVASTAVSGADGEDELVADWRRAKRLKKLNRMMTSSVAQQAAERYRKHTYLLTALITVVHVVCFVVLVTQINARYETAKDVNDMAQATERSQMIGMRANFIQKCGSPDSAAYVVCSEKHVTGYIEKMLDNYEILTAIHHNLYLGATTLRQFRDPRLMDKWTYTPLEQKTWYANTAQGNEVIVTDNTTLWEMGNKYLQTSLEVRFNAKELAHELEHTSYWQYIYLNGLTSLFDGYKWSLDVFVDFAWGELGTLTNVLVVLLVIEALLVQCTSMVYQFLLLKASASEAMKRCSAFLALPSATVRSMASRQILVDDDDKSDLDDDELEAINAAGQQTEGDTGQATGKEGDAKQTKSVRMSVSGAPEDDAPSGAAKKKKGLTGLSKAGAASTGLAGKKKAKTVLQRMNKFLFSWARTTFKVNGKKLLPHTTFLWRYMLPLVLWVATVIIIFGVSFQKLQGLQAPLASLNAAAHVRYRLARCRVMANIYAFAENPTDVALYRGRLKDELKLMKSEYDALLYGGTVTTIAPDLHFDPHTPAAAFANEQFSQIFFKTTACQREDKSLCFDESSKWYGVTHSGLDAMVVRYIDEMTTFANLPDSLAYPNHTSYDYVSTVAAADMYDGLTTAAGMFVDYTITRFEEVKQLHIILLVVSLVLILGFVFKMFRPYVRKLHAESKALAGMMSLLPAEVDIEGHIKTIVLGLSKDRAGNSMRSASMQLEPPGMQGNRGVGPGGGGPMRLLPGPPAGPGGGGGWFGGRGGGPAGAAPGGVMVEYGAPQGGGGGWGGGGGGGGMNPRGTPHWG